MRLFIRPASIRARLLLASTVVQVVLLTLLLANSVRLMNDATFASLTTLIDHNASMLHAMATTYGEQERYPQMQDVLGELLAGVDEGLVYVRVSRPGGQLLVSAGLPEITTLPPATESLARDRNTFSGTDIIHVRRPLLLPRNEVGFFQFGVSASVLSAARRAIIEQGALIALAEIILTFVLLSGIGYLLTHNLSRLLAGSKAIAEGHLDHRLPARGDDELAHLSRHFNVMAETLQARIGELQETASRLAISEERYALALQGANDGLWDWDIVSGAIYYSDRFYEILGRNQDEYPLISSDFSSLLHPDDAPAHRQLMREHLKGNSLRFFAEHRVRLPDGSYRWIVTRGVARHGPDGRATRMAGSISDIDLRKQAEHQLLHDALHDGLTGLPNRALFIEHVRRALGQQRRDPGYRFAVLAINLERFSLVNDSYGHAVGDALLRLIARHISASIREGDIAARVGGDQFALLLNDLEDSAEALRFAETLVDFPGFSVQSARQTLHPRARVGVAFNDSENIDAETLLRDADNALHKARYADTLPVAVFHASMHTQTLHILQLETELRAALQQRTLSAHYQPIVSLADWLPTSFEALAYWRHPLRGLLSPAEFIPLAETLNLIHELGMQILDCVCQDIAYWTSQGQSPLPVSVNLSARQLGRATLADELLATLTRHGTPPALIRFEVTESLLARHDGPATSTLQRLREAGITVLIDDFGTGYSALSYLHTIPCDILKLDGSFVHSITENVRLRTTVQRSIELAHDLGMVVVAECIDDEAQVTTLQQLGCDYGQGYLFSPPVSRDLARAMLNSPRAITAIP